MKDDEEPEENPYKQSLKLLNEKVVLLNSIYAYHPAFTYRSYILQKDSGTNAKEIKSQNKVSEDVCNAILAEAENPGLDSYIKKLKMEFSKIRELSNEYNKFILNSVTSKDQIVCIGKEAAKSVQSLWLQQTVHLARNKEKFEEQCKKFDLKNKY